MSPLQRVSSPFSGRQGSRPVLGFAHRGGAAARKDHNTLSAFRSALAAGAKGLESDVALTADGCPVLEHVGLFPRRGTRTSGLHRRELPSHIPSLSDLYGECGSNFELSLDMAEPRAASEVVRVATEYAAADHLWLTYWKFAALQEWRMRWPRIHLVYPTIPVGARRFEQTVNRLVAIGVDVVNVHHRFCSPRVVEIVHRHDLCIFVWGLKHAQSLQRAMSYGVDGVYCDDVAMMVETLHCHDT